MSDDTNPDLDTETADADRRDHRFRIAGDPAEAMKVVLAQLRDSSA